MTEGDLSSQSLFELLRSCKLGEAGAIVGGHIDRNQLRKELYVPTEADSVVTEFFVSEYQEDGKLLIITGSAGDGKSALLSRGFKEAKDAGIDALSESHIHMDATAATKKTESYAGTLRRFLDEAAKSAVRGTGTRTGLAINLGLAIDFFERRGHQEDFPEVWSAIEAARTKRLHETDHVVVLNLGFRPIYSVQPGSLGEGILGELVNKFDATDPESPFHEAYTNAINNCPADNECPLCHNATQLGDPRVRETITNLFAAKGIIENAYLNPRRLIHHLASILLPSNLEATSATHDACPVGKSVKYGRGVEPDTIFWNSVFNELEEPLSPSSGMLDPAASVTKEVDLHVIELGSNPHRLDEALADVPLSDNLASEDRIRTYLRKAYLTKEPELGLRTAIDWSWFEEQFLSAYAYLESEEDQLSGCSDLRQGASDVNRTLQHSLKGWTGTPVEGEYIEYIDGIKTPDYRFLAKWSSPNIDEGRSHQRTREESTPGQMWFVLDPDTSSELVPIPLTFNLYVLMHRISRGYSPNARDIERSEGLRLIQTRLSEFTEKHKRTRVMDKSGEELFSLERGGFGAIEVNPGREA